MKKINFTLTKNDINEISEKNIKCIESDKLLFIINKDKYIYHNNILEKHTSEGKIIFDFKKEECKLYINGYNDYFLIKINVIEYKKNDSIISIKYKIETEENIINKITIEYV